MAGALRQPRTFKYATPTVERGKTIMWLARTDILFADVQILKEGGETNLHSHSHLDGFWMVLSGRARFYGEGDQLIADLGQHEGVLLPRGTRYWFESVGAEPLEVLQIEASDQAMLTNQELMADRVDYTPRPVGGPPHAAPGGRAGLAWR
jgi:mannose-6-phosphate isomerase-like protein (cupin superfamily)